MEFKDKLKKLRQKNGITQEELAKALYVSRTAISKWESGRGFPNLASLKGIAEVFSLSVDELISGDEILTLAQEEGIKKGRYFKDLIFGCADICALMLIFLPFFAQRAEGKVTEVSLMELCEVSLYLKTAYCLIIGAIVLWGILTLALQNCNKSFWIWLKNKASLTLNLVAVIMLVLGLHPYAAVFMFAFLIIKILILIRK